MTARVPSAYPPPAPPLESEVLEATPPPAPHTAISTADIQAGTVNEAIAPSPYAGLFQAVDVVGSVTAVKENPADIGVVGEPSGVVLLM